MFESIRSFIINNPNISFVLMLIVVVVFAIKIVDFKKLLGGRY